MSFFAAKKGKVMPCKDAKLVEITVQGGVVDVTCLPPGVVVKVYDYDIEGEEGELQKDDQGTDCVISTYYGLN
jgi:hypothetical protein